MEGLQWISGNYQHTGSIYCPDGGNTTDSTVAHELIWGFLRPHQAALDTHEDKHSEWEGVDIQNT